MPLTRHSCPVGNVDIMDATVNEGRHILGQRTGMRPPDGRNLFHAKAACICVSKLLNTADPPNMNVRVLP